jgi:hypothetical protein
MARQVVFGALLKIGQFCGGMLGTRPKNQFPCHINSIAKKNGMKSLGSPSINLRAGHARRQWPCKIGLNEINFGR